MGKSILTMSAAQRLKAQERQSRRFDRAVNRKFKEMKKAWKKKIAGKAVKGVAFVAAAAAAGAVIGKAKEVVKTKNGDELREMASKVKVKFEEKKAAVKKFAMDAAGAKAEETAGKTEKTTAQNAAEAASGESGADGVSEAAKANAAGESAVAGSAAE